MEIRQQGASAAAFWLGPRPRGIISEFYGGGFVAMGRTPFYCAPKTARNRAVRTRRRSPLPPPPPPPPPALEGTGSTYALEHWSGGCFANRRTVVLSAPMPHGEPLPSRAAGRGIRRIMEQHSTSRLRFPLRSASFLCAGLEGKIRPCRAFAGGKTSKSGPPLQGPVTWTRTTGPSTSIPGRQAPGGGGAGGRRASGNLGNAPGGAGGGVPDRDALSVTAGGTCSRSKGRARAASLRVGAWVD